MPGEKKDHRGSRRRSRSRSPKKVTPNLPPVTLDEKFDFFAEADVAGFKIFCKKCEVLRPLTEVSQKRVQTGRRGKFASHLICKICGEPEIAYGPGQSIENRFHILPPPKK